MNNVLIRCDASRDIGLGHITRCLVLANQFKDNGDNIFFAIKNYELAKEKLLNQKFDMIIAQENDFDYFRWIREIVEEKDINIFVGDIRDGFPSELIVEMKNKDILTIAIDEPSEYAKECDLCFYPPHAIINEKDYKGKIYQGLEYVLLRPEFYKPFEKKKNEVPNILVMMGGTDTFNLTFPIIKQVDKSNEKFQLNVIIPKDHKDFLSISEYSKISEHKVNIFNRIKDMSYFLNNMDYAICQFGTIVYELLIKNIPSINLFIDQVEYNNIFNKDKIFIDDFSNEKFEKLLNEHSKNIHLSKESLFLCKLLEKIENEL